MAKIKSEDLRLNIIVNGAAKAAKDVGMAGKSISELQKELKLAKKALAQAIPGTENFKQLQQTVKTTSDRLREGRHLALSVLVLNHLNGEFCER